MEAGEYLSSLQLGTGVSGGVEIAACRTRLAPQAGDNILAGLKDGLLELRRLFVTSHSFSSELRAGSGELLGYSHTGVHQGNLLGGTYQNVGFQPTLVMLDERIREVVRRAMPKARAAMRSFRFSRRHLCCCAARAGESVGEDR